MYKRVEVRQQNDLLSAEQKAEMFGTVCDPAENVTRQEFKAECDTATLLQRFGAGQAFPVRPAFFGEVDYDLNLQDAIHAMRAAQAAFERLPADLQRRYQGWGALADAIARGEVKAPEAPASGSGGAAGASASESAPDAKG